MTAYCRHRRPIMAILFRVVRRPFQSLAPFGHDHFRGFRYAAVVAVVQLVLGPVPVADGLAAAAAVARMH